MEAPAFQRSKVEVPLAVVDFVEADVLLREHVKHSRSYTTWRSWRVTTNQHLFADYAYTQRLRSDGTGLSPE